MPLTDVVCRKIKSSLRPRKLSDGGGLYLLVDRRAADTGGWPIDFGGKQKTLALGIYPTVSLADARAARDEAKRQLAEGTDPSQARKKGKLAAKLLAENTFEALAREWPRTRKEAGFLGMLGT